MKLKATTLITSLLLYSASSGAWWWPNNNQTYYPYPNTYPAQRYYLYTPPPPQQAFTTYNAIEFKKASDYSFAKIMEESRIKREAMIKHLQEKQADIKKKMEARRKKFEAEIYAQRNKADKHPASNTTPQTTQ